MDVSQSMKLSNFIPQLTQHSHGKFTLFVGILPRKAWILHRLLVYWRAILTFLKERHIRSVLPTTFVCYSRWPCPAASWFGALWWEDVSSFRGRRAPWRCWVVAISGGETGLAAELQRSTYPKYAQKTMEVCFSSQGWICPGVGESQRHEPSTWVIEESQKSMNENRWDPRN